MSNSKDEIEIYLDENSFCSFPSVVLIDDNKVLVAFRKAGNFSLKAGSDNNPTHHDNDSCICLITSTDGGQSYNKDDIKIVTKFEESRSEKSITFIPTPSSKLFERGATIIV